MHNIPLIPTFPLDGRDFFVQIHRMKQDRHMNLSNILFINTQPSFPQCSYISPPLPSLTPGRSLPCLRAILQAARGGMTVLTGPIR